jgi:hypothetical protein
MCLSDWKPGDSAITDAGNTYGSQPGNIESVPVMPSSPEPSTNVDLSESIGKGNNIVVKKMA